MYYQQEAKFIVAVDGIILGFRNNELYVLITKRIFEPLKGKRSLMGGFPRIHESLDEAAVRVIHEYTGLKNIRIEQVGAYGDIDRDLGSRVISVAYYALINMEQYDDKLNRSHHAEWVNIKNIGKLVLDHNRMLKDALKIIRRRAATRPIGFDLLPQKFTLPQFQALYEAIYQTAIDKRNFRNRIQQMDILEKLDEKDKLNSKKGAYYYIFNKKKYDMLLEQGYSVSFIHIF
ncbi:DNA mismatch repair protein MutT [Bacteroidia bacterium]|nr:DNA mismatch repair protein MutT [Bacteroidia bacterium]